MHRRHAQKTTTLASDCGCNVCRFSLHCGSVFKMLLHKGATMLFKHVALCTGCTVLSTKLLPCHSWPVTAPLPLSWFCNNRDEQNQPSVIFFKRQAKRVIQNVNNRAVLSKMSSELRHMNMAHVVSPFVSSVCLLVQWAGIHPFSSLPGGSSCCQADTQACWFDWWQHMRHFNSPGGAKCGRGSSTLLQPAVWLKS